MTILGIDTSGNVGSVAIVTDGILVGEFTINHKKTHSQSLMVMLDELCQMVEVDIESVDAFAISAGPGSFTGLRIGSTTAKGLGLALNKPVIPVSTLEALAYNLRDMDGLICPIMDARRGQVYTGLYSFADGVNAGDRIVNTVAEADALDINELISNLNNQQEHVTFLGDGVPVHKDTIQTELKCDYTFAGAANCLQRGASVALRGSELYAEGKYENASDHSPIYLRLSQAERERMEKQEAEK